MVQTGKILEGKRQRRRKMPRAVLERLEEKFQVSSRTICRWITAGEQDVIEAALEFVQELVTSKKVGRAKMDKLNKSLNELYTLSASSASEVYEESRPEVTH